MEIRIGLTDAQRAGVVDILQRLLADEYVLYTKTRNYHWNVTGPRFHDLHKLFEEQYEALDEVIDELAERSRALGAPAVATLTEFLQLARLKEEPAGDPDDGRMIANLLADHETLIRQLRIDLEAAGERFRDAGTNDFLTGLMERHEKTAWMLRALADRRSEAGRTTGDLRQVVA
jgi:starvation-inducible DNA-binding protein